MSIEKLLNNKFSTEKSLGEEFYHVASFEENSKLIKSLLIKLDYKPKFTSKVLTYGILATLELNKEQNFHIISNFIEKNQIPFDNDILTNALTHPLENHEKESFSSISKFMIEKQISPDRKRLLSFILDSIESKKSITDIIDFWENTGIKMPEDFKYFQIIYNCATTHQREDITSLLNQKFHITKLSLEQELDENIDLVNGAISSWCNLNKDGSVSISGCAGGELDKDTERLIFYDFNPFLFNLIKKPFNQSNLTEFFNEETVLSHSLLTHAIVRSVAFNHQESISFLLKNAQCKLIIQNSNDIKSFLYSEENWPENKIEARKLLNLKNKFKI